MVIINNKKCEKKKLIIFFLCCSAFLFAFQMLISWTGYWFGTLWYPNYWTNKNSVPEVIWPIDNWIPWCTWFFPLYMLIPITWFIFIPLIAWFTYNGKKEERINTYFEFFINVVIMHIISWIIFTFSPTTCRISNWIKNLDKKDVFYWLINTFLAGSHFNVFCAIPSLHNYWAVLFIIFGVRINNKKIWLSILSIVIGICVSLSTLFLHQHNIIDIIITYPIAIGISIAVWKFKLVEKMKKFIINKKILTN